MEKVPCRAHLVRYRVRIPDVRGPILGDCTVRFGFVTTAILRSESGGSKLVDVVIFFELLLALAAVAIIAFSLYVVYRLVTEES